jgi:hypothetical protein
MFSGLIAAIVCSAADGRPVTLGTGGIGLVADLGDWAKARFAERSRIRQRILYMASPMSNRSNYKTLYFTLGIAGLPSHCPISIVTGLTERLLYPTQKRRLQIRSSISIGPGFDDEHLELP